jgi:hypothetical protein
MSSSTRNNNTSVRKSNNGHLSQVIEESPQPEEYQDESEEELSSLGDQEDSQQSFQEDEEEDDGELPSQITETETIDDDADELVEEMPVIEEDDADQEALLESKYDDFDSALNRIDALAKNKQKSKQSSTKSISESSLIASSTKASRAPPSSKSISSRSLSRQDSTAVIEPEELETEEIEIPEEQELKASSNVHPASIVPEMLTGITKMQQPSINEIGGTGNQLQIVLQYHDKLSPESKMKLLSCFMSCLHRLLEQESRKENWSVEELQKQLEQEEKHLEQLRQAELQQAPATKSKEFLTMDTYESGLCNTPIAVHQYWKQIVTEYKMNPTNADRLKAMVFMIRNLKGIFQTDQINYHNASRLMQLDPRFKRVYECLRSQTMTLNDIQCLHQQVVRPLALSVALAEYFHTHPQHRPWIQRMMCEPQSTNLAIKSIGAKDFRDLALSIKSLSTEDKCLLSLHLSLILPTVQK